MLKLDWICVQLFNTRSQIVNKRNWTPFFGPTLGNFTWELLWKIALPHVYVRVSTLVHALVQMLKTTEMAFSTFFSFCINSVPHNW